MKVFNGISGKDEIDKFEIEDDKIKIYYCDGSYKYIENTDENQRVLLIEELNFMKRVINYYDKVDLDHDIEGYNTNINIANKMEALVMGMIIAANVILYERINMPIDAKILATTALYQFSRHINQLFSNVTNEYVENIKKLEVISQLVKRNKLYISNIDLFERPIQLVDPEVNRDTGYIRITPNNIDEYSYEDINFCVKVFKKTKEIEKKLKKE